MVYCFVDLQAFPLKLEGEYFLKEYTCFRGLTFFLGQGVLALTGMHDAHGKPILLCSCNNNTVYLYDLPS